MNTLVGKPRGLIDVEIYFNCAEKETFFAGVDFRDGSRERCGRMCEHWLAQPVSL